jgi:hypothetical protein
MILKVTGNTSVLEFIFEYHIFNDNLEIAILGFYSTHLIPNFTNKNNKIGNITVPPGQYTLYSLKEIIRDLTFNEVHNKFNLSNEVLDRPRKLFPIETVNIHCNIANGMITTNHKETDIISCFKISETFRQPISYEPTNIIYFPVQHRSIHKIILKVCDQDDNLIDFNGADITIILEIRNNM